MNQPTIELDMLANSNSANVAAAIAMAAATGSNPLQHASPQLQIPAASPAPAHQLPPSMTIPGSNNSSSSLQPSLYMLQWHEHHTSFFQLMEELCQSQTMTDVTVACGDVSLEAHSLILSASSPILRSILNKGGGFGKKQTLHFMDMNPHHMQLLLQYMYRGEVSVHQSELGPLMQSAKALQIKGLSGGNPEDKINDFATFLAGATSSQPQKGTMGSSNPQGMTNTTNISPTGAPPINVPTMPAMIVKNENNECIDNNDSKKRKFSKDEFPQNLTNNGQPGDQQEKGRRKSRLSRTGKNSPPVQQQASPTSTSTDNHNNVPPAHQQQQQQQHHGMLNAPVDNSQTATATAHQHPSNILGNNLARNVEVGVVVDDDMHGFAGGPATTTTQTVTTLPQANPPQGNMGGTPTAAGQNLDDSQSGGSVMENWSDQPTMKVKVKYEIDEFICKK